MIRMTSGLHTGQSGRSEASDFQFRYAPVTLGSGRENLIGLLMTIYHFSMFLLVVVSELKRNFADENQLILK